jgi:hypothetical protein
MSLGIRSLVLALFGQRDVRVESAFGGKPDLPIATADF